MNTSPWSVTEDKELGGESFVAGSSPAALTAQMILEAISLGKLSLGERLPSERSLAEELNVGRSAIREAIAALEILGIVEAVPGSGTYVRSSTSEVLPKTLSWGLFLNRNSLVDLMEIRTILEMHMASSVAQAKPLPDLRKLEDAVEAQAHATENADNSEYVKADLAFHLELGHLCGNSIISYLASSIRSLLRVWIDRQVRDKSDMVDALNEHKAILIAIKSNDPEQAERAMTTHMQTAERRLLNSISHQQDSSDE